MRLSQFSIISASVIVGLLVGFGLAWWIKPEGRASAEAVASRARARQGVSPVATGRPGMTKAASSDFLWRLRETGYSEEGRSVLFADLSPAEIPGLLAEMKAQAGIYQMDNLEAEQFESLFKAWYAKAPEAALSWLQALPHADDKERLLGMTVDGLAETDLTAAVNLLRQEGCDENGRIGIPEVLLENAPTHGAETLVEFCRLGLYRGTAISGNPLTYPDEFNFKQALDGLAEAKTTMGGDCWFSDVPCNLVKEWARRDPLAAWEWVQQGKTIEMNGSKEFFAGCAMSAVMPVKEIGGMLASAMETAETPGDGYENVWAALGGRPSPELLDGFLEALPGGHATHLNGLFDATWSWLGKNLVEMQVCELLLERMTPEQRAETLKRNEPYLRGPDAQRDFSAILRRIGHSEEEARAMLPPYQ